MFGSGQTFSLITRNTIICEASTFVAKNILLNKINVGAVSYLNTKPLLYGIKQSSLITQINLIEDYPSRIGAMLIDGSIDIGLVPVAVIPKMPQYFLVSNYCIGAINNVASVSLFSQVPIDDVDTVLLDYQSRTSVALTKILMKKFWQKKVVFMDASENYVTKIKGNVAGVIIGDRALQVVNNFKYNYDLAAAWHSYTQLPFVFATWVANKPMSQNFIDEFNRANSVGLNAINDVINSLEPCSYYNLNHYYTNNIAYNFTKEMKEGLSLFLQLLKDYSD